MLFQLGIHLMANVLHRLPLRRCVGFGHARVFMDARDLHGKIKMRFALARRADHRRGG